MVPVASRSENTTGALNLLHLLKECPSGRLQEQQHCPGGGDSERGFLQIERFPHILLLRPSRDGTQRNLRPPTRERAVVKVQRRGAFAHETPPAALVGSLLQQRTVPYCTEQIYVGP